MRIAWIALVVVMTCKGAQSDEPPKAPRVPINQQTNSSADNEKKSDQQPRTTADKPTVIPSPPHHHQDKKRSDESDETAYDRSEYWPIFGRNLKITDTLLAAFTAILVIVGAWQGIHLKRTVDSFMTGERPYLFPTLPDTKGLLPTGLRRTHYPNIPIEQRPVPTTSIRFGNFGKTIGIIREVRGELVFGEIPTKPKFGYSKPYLGQQVTRSEQQTEDMYFIFDRSLTPAELNKILAGEMKVHFFGYVKYTDIFDRLHEKRFCFRIYMRAQMQPRCETAGGRAFNYSKSKKTPKEYEG